MIKTPHLLLFIVAISLSACLGIGYTMKGGTIPGNTFSIENFENNAPLGNPNLNIIVQDLLRDRLLKETNLKSVAVDGDANFTGTITNYTITPVVGTGEATVNLNRVTITLTVSYTNSINGKNDFSQTFTDFDDFDSSLDISTQEDELIETIGDKLVNQIFNQVLIDW